MTLQRITPFLWFDHRVEEAVNFYVAVFRHSRIGRIARYGEAGQDVHGQKPGTVMTIDFELEGQKFAALNGGPQFQFTEAVSFVVNCASQEEIDYYWEKLSADGDKQAQRCGWLKDRYGLSWQIVPTVLPELMSDPARAERVMNALLQMKKLDIAALQQA